jgi:hypothetical protein
MGIDPHDGLMQAVVALLGDDAVKLVGVLEEPQREQRWKDRRAS